MLWYVWLRPEHILLKVDVEVSWAERILLKPRWPCEPHPAAESASSPARPWLARPPPAAASLFADTASPPERQTFGARSGEPIWSPAFWMMANVCLSIGYLFSGPLLSGLSLHLLDLQRVHPPAAHKQIMVPNAQLEDLHQGKKVKSIQEAAVVMNAPRRCSLATSRLLQHLFQHNSPAYWLVNVMSWTWKRLSSCPEVWW